MSLESQYAALTTGVVTHKYRTGITGYGAPSYSTAKTYPAYFEPVQRVVVTDDGSEVISRGRLYVLSTSATINTEDFIALDASTHKLRILNVNTLRDLDGQHHLEIDV